MKKIVWLILATVLIGYLTYLFQSSRGYPTDQIDDDNIYFFGQEKCLHCIHAKAYISEKYPDLKITYLDIWKPKNQVKFLACADKFGLDKQKLGTPLICMGQNFVIGWGDKDPALFDEYVKAFIPDTTNGTVAN